MGYHARACYCCHVSEVSDIEARRLARATWPVRKYALGREPSDNLSLLSVSDRVAMVWRVTQDAWALGKLPVPDYARADIPGRVIRRGR